MRQVRWVGGMMLHPEVEKVFGGDQNVFAQLYLALDGHRIIAGLTWEEVIKFAEAGIDDFEVIKNETGMNCFVFKESTAIGI